LAAAKLPLAIYVDTEFIVWSDRFAPILRLEEGVYRGEPIKIETLSAIGESEDSFIEAVGDLSNTYDAICSIYGQSLGSGNKEEQAILREASEKLGETLTLLRDRQLQGGSNG
jgi:hypothetical protein